MHSLQSTLGSSELSPRRRHTLPHQMRSLYPTKKEDTAARSTMEESRVQEKTHMRSLRVPAQGGQSDPGISHGWQHAECCPEQSQDCVFELCGRS
jgi:hypothetical protein